MITDGRVVWEEVIQTFDALSRRVDHVVLMARNGDVQNECLRKAQAQPVPQWTVEMQRIVLELLMRKGLIGLYQVCGVCAPWACAVIYRTNDGDNTERRWGRRGTNTTATPT